MAKELRITFKESEMYLYEYIKQKSSPSAFLKDLAAIEQRRETIYLNNQVATNEPKFQQAESVVEPVNIDDLDISDLDI
ncbi:MAG: hypothetical protein II005_05390, partial [Turicibacter sp.]|nr:hypothetical protein [Turicibacter sp.]